MRLLRPLLCALAAALLAACASPPRFSGPPPLRRDRRWKLVSPILDLDEDIRFEEFSEFRKKLTALVKAATRAPSKVEHIAVYFRDLDNGPWFGIDENETFAPASLLKVPIMMSLLKQAEQRPSLLQLQAGSGALPDDRPQLVPPRRQAEPGTLYSVNDLLELMIVYSDNRAHDLLLGLVDKRVYLDIFEDLGVPVADPQAPEARLTVRQYATFFRILYNASYLNPAMSEKALELLSRSDFRAGIAAGVPAGTLVANKFGERGHEAGDMLQIHDCGIVYYPKHPYLLCVMTRGGSLTEQEGAIQRISALAYKEVASGK